ncbi:MAG TPA: gamma-glutamyltransferase [Gaiellales bacterium]|jgi:gamma-glutamyltranspeptidase/glutathione hydrolase
MPEPRRYAIATPHLAATEAGRTAFEAGGNAVDAALAAACVLTVVYPHMNAVGGDVMALVHDGRAHAVNGSGRAPAGLSAGAVARGVPVRGVGSITVPGAVRAWQTLADRWGTRPLSRALLGAAAVAHEGVAVAPSLARSLADASELIAADAGMRAVFAPGGTALREGDRLVQEQLARTLERLAAVGPDDLYTGETGELLVSGLAALGCELTAADFAAHRTDVDEALRGRLGDEQILTMGPNSQGFSLIQIMAAVDRLALERPLGADARLLAAVFRESARDRDAHLADPAAMRTPVGELISDTHIAELAARAAASAGAGPARVRPAGDTIALVAADDSGLAVSLIQSIFFGFGSGVLEPRTGILCHNRGACFSPDPASPNALGAGKRPLHTLMPVVVERDGRAAWVAGTMGGRAQAQIHAQLLLHRRAGADPAAAVAAPRMIVGEAGLDDEVCIEADHAGARAAFPGTDPAPLVIPARSDAAGHAHAIAFRADGTFAAGSDPRADGGAVVGG